MAIVLTPCEEPAEELLRRVRVAPPLDQDIAHVPVLIHRGYCPGIGHQSICIRLVGLTLLSAHLKHSLVLLDTSGVQFVLWEAERNKRSE